MNILFLCKKVPFPPTDGESIVIMNDLKVLKVLGHKVNLFCLNTKKHWVDTKGYRERSLWDDFQTEAMDTNSFPTLVKALWSAAPFQIARFYNSDIDSYIDNFVKHKEIDLIIYQGLAMTQYQRSTKCKKIYRVHNMEFKVWSMLATQSKNYLKKQFNHCLSKSLKFYEEYALKDFSGAITLSYEEKNGLQEFYTKMKMTTIPISINSENRFQYSAEKKGLLFMGSLDWQPNREGLDWFLQNVYPALNNIPLTIAGKGDFKCDVENVTIIPNYESTEELLANHRFMIVPLLSGAGIRIKILEAMKFGMPLISTKIGAEGIECHQGSMMCEDAAENWITHIQLIYNQYNLLLDMSKKAKVSFESHYSEKAISSKWDIFLNGLSESQR